MVVHFPDTALTFTDELIVDRSGTRWRMTTVPQYDLMRQVYVMRTTLRNAAHVVSGWFTVPEDVVLGLEADGDLRMFALREIKKHLDRTSLHEGFAFDLPFRFVL